MRLDLSLVNFDSASRSFSLKMENFTVTFKVKKGSWDDGSKADKTKILSRRMGEDLALNLYPQDFPSAGEKPDDGYARGAWDSILTEPRAITEDMTYTYTYTYKNIEKEITGYYCNIKKGTAYLTLKGTGSYYGERKAAFKIGATRLSDIWGGIMRLLQGPA